MSLPHRSLLLFLSLLTLSSGQNLQPFTNCQSLTAYYKNAALSRVGPYGLQGSPGRFPKRRGPVPPAAPEKSPQDPRPGTDFSETNVQVDGVDEPDIIKTDGSRVFVVNGNTFHVVTVKKNGKNGKQTGVLQLPTFAREMLIQGDDILIIATQYGFLDGSNPSSKRSKFGNYFLYLPFGQPLTIIYHVSVAKRKPRLMATLRMEGSYLNAREVDGVARIITTSTPSRQIKFEFPNGGSDERATRRNKDIIRETNTGAWLSRFLLKDKSGVTRGFLTPCSSVFRPTRKFAGFAQLTVTTLPLSGPLKPRNSVSIASDGDEVYSTVKSLYVTTTDYRYDFSSTSSREAGPLFQTSLHKFALTKTSQTYVGSGRVSGSLLNQFSMHEYMGRFYVATTEGARWWAQRDTSVSKVTAFSTNERKRKLVEIGKVGNLGVGERIFAVRYIQDTAYVVTFRQVDPLYIISLKQLRVLGELKIPGFSSYLHLIAPGRILGVGREATPEGRVTGAKVSLFDVSDVTKPAELSAWTLKGGFSSVEWDHRAFLYWEPEKVAVLPLSVFDNGDFFAGSVVLEISSTEITERGRVTHPACCGSTRSPRIIRNLILGRTNLWSLSQQLLQTNGIKELDLQARVPLVRPKSSRR